MDKISFRLVKVLDGDLLVRIFRQRFSNNCSVGKKLSKVKSTCNVLILSTGFTCDYALGMFSPSHKVEVLFVSLGGMLGDASRCNLCIRPLYHLLILGNQMSTLRRANVVNLLFEI